MDKLTTSIVGIDLPNENTSKSNRRMEGMLCAPGDAVELGLEPANPYDENAVAIFSARGIQLGDVSAERVPLIEAAFCPARSGPRCSETPASPLGAAGPAAGL
jgi:hypothetical protein